MLLLERIEKYLNESKYSEGDKVKYLNKVWEVLEVEGKMLVITTQDGKERDKVYAKEVTKVK